MQSVVKFECQKFTYIKSVKERIFNDKKKNNNRGQNAQLNEEKCAHCLCFVFWNSIQSGWSVSLFAKILEANQRYDQYALLCNSLYRINSSRLTFKSKMHDFMGSNSSINIP